MESIELLKKLISFPSFSRENANEAIRFVRDYLESFKIYGKIIENNGYYSYVTTIGSGKETLILNGHLDVVSGSNAQFIPKEKEGRIIGRGSADMKSGCVAMIQSIIRLKDVKLKNKIMLQLVTDEETGGINCTKHLVDTGYLGNFVICTEPTNLCISLQAKGIIRIDVITKGKSAHGSRPWEGENAIIKAYDNYRKIKKLDILNKGSEFYENSSVNLAFINGGDIYNRVPDSSIMGFDIRYVPEIDPNKIIKAIQKCIEGEVIVKAIEPGVYGLKENKYTQKLSQSLKRVMPHMHIQYSVQHGGSDGRYYAQKGIPIVEFGPKGNYWHGDDEYVEIQSVKDLEEVLVDFIKVF